MSRRRSLCSASAQCTGLSGCPKEFNEQFMEAWKVIEGHDIASLQQSISKMTNALDVFRVLEISGILYPMTLLALCGFHRQKDMVDLLIKKGAKITAGCDLCGGPLFQMLYHCLIKKEEMDTSMVEYFIEKGAPLRRQICTLEYGIPKLVTIKWSVLDLPLIVCRTSGIEVAKVLVKSEKMDHITGGAAGADYDVVPMFQEYWHSGTNHYIRWLCKEYLSAVGNQRRGFVDRVVDCITSMKRRPKRWIYKRRTPSHAMLTCGHQETIKLLLQKDRKLLSEVNSTGKTALHMAAENGDLESVKILLELGADVTASDCSHLNPFMVAIEKNNLEVAKTILKENPELGSQSAAIDWALEKDLTSFFQCVGEVAPNHFVTPLSNRAGNTIVHLVAASGNSEVFKIVLDKLWNVVNMEFVNKLVQDTNEEGKTALQLGVERGCTDMLKELQNHIQESYQISFWETELQNMWSNKVIPGLFCHASSCGSLVAVKYFINSGYEANFSHDDKTPLLCASQAGHDEIVKYLLQFGVVTSNSEHLKLPLLRAAANGHTKCVSLLLQKTTVHHTDEDGKNCLMLAIENDHRVTALAILSNKDKGLAALRCVHKKHMHTPLRLLIKKMPDLAEYVLNRCITHSDEPGNTTQEKILYDFRLLADFLPDFSPTSDDPKDKKPRTDGSATNDGATLNLLMEIDAAETDSVSLEVQDNATTQEKLARVQSDTGASFDSEEIELVKTHYGTEWSATDHKHIKETDEVINHNAECHTPKFHLKYDSDNHILRWMIKYKRLELLQHPLVEEFLFQRFWLVAIPLFLLYLLLYTSLLIFLTSFVVVSPRPGPDNGTCSERNRSILTNDTDCPGQSGADRKFLIAAAIIMIIHCFVFLILEAVQFYQRRIKYFKEWSNCFRVICFVLIITFIAPGFTNDCWCAHNWQWQVGAFALCLGWFHFILLLKHLPWTAVPVNMFISVCKTFLKVLYLPFFLLLGYALPAYMVFARTASSFEGPDPPGELVAFSSPGHAIAKTMVQLVGALDFEVIFNGGDLLYSPTTYILFIIFLITMTILFVNLLIGLAVGDINKERKKAQFTKLAVPVEFILEQEQHFKFLHFKNLTKKFNRLNEGEDNWGHLRSLAQYFQLKCEFTRPVKVEDLEKRNKAIFSDVMKVTSDSEKILRLEEVIRALKEKMEASSFVQTARS